MFGKSQSYRVEKSRPDVEEVTIQQAHNQQGKHRKGNEDNITMAFLPEHTDGLQPVNAVAQQSHKTAACQKLNHGVVPPGGKDGLDLLHGGPLLDFIGAGIEAFTKNGIFQEDPQALRVELFPHSGIQTPFPKLCKHQVQLRMKNEQKNHQNQQDQTVKLEERFLLCTVFQHYDHRGGIT